MEPQSQIRAQLFGRDAARYDRARPSYPATLIDDLVADGPSRILDVGCGTGKAGRLFAARGCEVLGVDPDDRMAAVARANGIPVEVATFEAWDPAGRTFNMIVSGQAWHWIDKDIGPGKAAVVLPAGAKLAVFWNRGSHDTETRSLLAEAYRRYAPAIEDGYAPLRNAAQTNVDDIAAIVATGSFETPELRLYRWTHRYSCDEWLDQLGTHSDHLLLPSSQFEALSEAIRGAIERIGGTISVSFQTELILARRTA